MTSGVVRSNMAAKYGVAVASGHPAEQAGWSSQDVPIRPRSASVSAAADALRLSQPQLSAAMPHPKWQIAVVMSAAALLPMAFIVSLRGDAGILAVVLSVPFLMAVLMRCAALWQLWRPDAAEVFAPLPDGNLPAYSVLVPLYRERAIAPALVEAMQKLDYPTNKLEIIFITEADDPETRDALASAQLLPHMRILTVPDGLPKTKPRALNYALQTANGALVCVFDAEDVPAPRQLRQAAEMFAAHGSNLSCVQARLGIYNADHSFLTRQFSLEYAALFEAILPALHRLGLPIPLGGTSNHFRRADLEAVGGWDAYNVTEDADLGLRLARAGKGVAMLASDTWEEAPASWKAWRGQRTRWLKGWMQTYLVHTRNPRALVRDLGAWRTAGVIGMLG